MVESHNYFIEDSDTMAQAVGRFGCDFFQDGVLLGCGAGLDL